ncbi:cytochrome P450 83B1-like [Mangifera indica]|uniref:cytochrome P450 83B1-like n=1 Tax=Mangifera indica TaxID=29780 RepID=UPI001CFAE473|nr:cytochrome P450 83B1-like [Mangifera indica]
MINTLLQLFTFSVSPSLSFSIAYVLSNQTKNHTCSRRFPIINLYIFIILHIPIFVLFILQIKKTSKSVRLPPGPRGLPLIGNLHQFVGSKPENVWKLSQKYGALMSLRLGYVPTLIVSLAKMAKEVMKTYDLVFCSRPALIGQQKLSYNGLDLVFSPYDNYYRELRKICVVHLFNSNRVADFRPVREDEVSRMIEKISKSAVVSKPVNLSEQMMFLTSTIISRIGFGKRYEDEGTERSRFHALLNETQALFVSFFLSDYFPFIGSWVDKLIGMVNRLENNFKEFDKFYQELIEGHLDPNKPKNDREDIIDVLLQVRKECGFKVDLTSDHIKAVLMNVFVAGTDTSAATVVWAMTYLMKNPEIMKKVQGEIRSKVGNKGFVDEDDLQNLPYLKTVVKENMRLQPTVPFLVPRETTENCVIEGYEIPPKTLGLVNTWAIGRDPEAWENPDEFYPERFKGSSIDFKGQHFELIPFGAGRKICLGLYMGIATVDLALSNLLYKFDWEMVPGMKKEDLDFDVLSGITMHKKNPLRLMVKCYK